MAEDEKIACRKCKYLYPKSSYSTYRTKTGRISLRGTCDYCRAGQVRDWKQNNKSRVQSTNRSAYERARSTDLNAYKEKRAAYARKFRRRQRANRQFEIDMLAEQGYFSTAHLATRYPICKPTISLLAKERKVEAILRRNKWYIKEDSLRSYLFEPQQGDGA